MAIEIIEHGKDTKYAADCKYCYTKFSYQAADVEELTIEEPGFKLAIAPPKHWWQHPKREYQSSPTKRVDNVIKCPVCGEYIDAYYIRYTVNKEATVNGQ